MPSRLSAANTPPYEPSAALKQAEEKWLEAVEAEEKARHAYRKAIADELRASGESHGRVAAATLYTPETVRGIAKEYGVPGKRQRAASPSEG
ncbi:hypothetical protein OG216_19550 [Streptomycetaceae bacterium NBC_01309]